MGNENSRMTALLVLEECSSFEVPNIPEEFRYKGAACMQGVLPMVVGSYVININACPWVSMGDQGHAWTSC